MGRHMLLALLIFSLLVFDVSDASFVREFRKLASLDPKNKTQDSEPRNEDKSNPIPDGEKHKENASSANSPAPQPQAVPKGDGVKEPKDDKKKTDHSIPSATATPPPPPPLVHEKGDGSEGKEGKFEGKKFSHSTTTETCEGPNTCADEGGMVACISKFDPKYLVILLQNRGDGMIKVRLRTGFENNLGDVDVDKNKIEKVNITQPSSKDTEVTLNAGKGDCVLHMGAHIPEGSSILRLPSYDKILTPVNGAYFLIVAVLVFGGTLACCMFRKKRHDEVLYQELEMALPESVSATNVESAEGWDQGWDDDWDDDNVAVKSPAAHHAVSISANGLTSRSSNKDGWENNWDD